MRREGGSKQIIISCNSIFVDASITIDVFEMATEAPDHSESFTWPCRIQFCGLGRRLASIVTVVENNLETGRRSDNLSGFICSSIMLETLDI